MRARPAVVAVAAQPYATAAHHSAAAQKDEVPRGEQGGFVAFPHGDVVTPHAQAYRTCPQVQSCL